MIINKIPGIIWQKKKKNWKVQNKINGKLKNIGYFRDFDKAVEAKYISEKENRQLDGVKNSPAKQYLIDLELSKKES